MKNYLWIGNYDDADMLAVMAQNGYRSSSSQVSQENLLQGLEETNNCVFDIISGSVLPSFPTYKEFLIRMRRWQHHEKANDLSVGYINIKYFNRISCQHSMKKAAMKWAYEHKRDNSDTVVFAYSMRSSVMSAACIVKEILPNAKLYLIITDLPEYMDLAPSKIKHILKRIDAIQQKKYLTIFDGYILYARKMAQYLDIENKPWLLIEGSLSIKECNIADSQPITSDENEIIIMYSGKISKNYGIPELLKAFNNLSDKKYRLWLTGSGDADSLVHKAAERDYRITHYGFLKTRQKLLDLQKRATMFVSMRMPTEPASDYCFPSKLFEYMITGKPVLSFNIGGIPEEYWNYIVQMKSPSAQDICNAIEKVRNMEPDERLQFGMRARNFIIQEKNNIAQAKKIWRFVENME